MKLPQKPSTLAQLGSRKDKNGAPTTRLYHAPPGGEFGGDEAPTEKRTSQMVAARLVRNWAACSVEDQRLIEALAVRLRPGVGD